MNRRYILYMAVLITVATPVLAQDTVYKVPKGQSDGRSVTYTDEKPEGRAELVELPPPPSVDEQQAAQERAAALKTKLEQIQQESEDQGAQGAPVALESDAARANLEKAKAAQEAGKQPIPTDFTGLKNGGIRLNEQYYERQRKLQEVVDAAVADLEATKTGLDTAR